MTKAPDKILDRVSRGWLYPTEPVESAEGVIRIDLDVAGLGEISAAISLVRTVCTVLYMGTYSRQHIGDQIVYLRVSSSGAQPAADALKRYGFKVKAVRQERDSAEKRVSSARIKLWQSGRATGNSPST